MHRFFKYVSFIKCVTTFTQEIPEEQKCNNYYAMIAVYVGKFGNRGYVWTSGDNHEKNAAAKWIRILEAEIYFCLVFFVFMPVFSSLNSWRFEIFTNAFCEGIKYKKKHFHYQRNFISSSKPGKTHGTVKITQLFGIFGSSHIKCPWGRKRIVKRLTKIKIFFSIYTRLQICDLCCLILPFGLTSAYLCI